MIVSYVTVVAQLLSSESLSILFDIPQPPLPWSFVASASQNTACSARTTSVMPIFIVHILSDAVVDCCSVLVLYVSLLYFALHCRLRVGVVVDDCCCSCGRVPESCGGSDLESPLSRFALTFLAYPSLNTAFSAQLVQLLLCVSRRFTSTFWLVVHLPSYYIPTYLVVLEVEVILQLGGFGGGGDPEAWRFWRWR